MAKLCISPCPNDTFAFHKFVEEFWQGEVEYHDIERLNSLAVSGIPDLCKISCALLPLVSEKYQLLDAGAALGFGNGPLLVARKTLSMSELSVAKIAIPGRNTTANRLMAKFFPQAVNKQPLIFSEIALAVAEGHFDAGVLIHEGRFTYQREGLKMIADLGKLWESATSMPIPLGCIVAKRSLGQERICEIEAKLSESVRYALENPSESRDYVRMHAQELDDETLQKHISFFVNQYTVTLGPAGRAAIEELLA